MDENPELSFVLKEIKEVLLKNEENRKSLKLSKRDLKGSKERCNEALKDVYKLAVNKLEEAFEETRSHLEQTYENLRECQEEKEKIVQRCNSVLMSEMMKLLGSKCDESFLLKCKDVLPCVTEAVQITGAAHNITFNFIPIPKFRKTKFGFIQLCDNLPSDFTLSRLTPMSCIAIGKQVSCGIRGELTKENLQHLEFGVRKETNIIPSKMIKVEDDLVSFSFDAEASGEYSVRASLFGENIAASPLSVTVASADTGEISITTDSKGLIMSGDISTSYHSGDSRSSQKLDKMEVASQKDVQKAIDTNEVVSEDKRPDKVQSEDDNQKENNISIDNFPQREEDTKQENKTTDKVNSLDNYQRKDDTENSNISQGNELTKDDNMFSSEANEAECSRMQHIWKVEDRCLAKWEEDSAWYNAQIIDIHPDGQVLVSFVDYGNSAIVTSWVNSFNEIPQTDEFDVNVIPTETNNNAVENLIFEVNKKGETEDVQFVGNDFCVGDICYARWDEDSVWYNGVVENIYGNGRYLVNFTDYGNSEVVCLPYIVKTASNIPEEIQKENIDQHVQHVLRGDQTVIGNVDAAGLASCLFPAGDVCVAKWSHDCTWYNAVVLSVQPNGEYVVVFSDYGNTATVQPTDVLKNAHAIPKDSTSGFIDENVKIVESCLENGDSNLVQDFGNIKEKSWSEFSVGQSCVARWELDQIWYNGRIIADNKNGSYMVNFVDYGNTENVGVSYIVEDGSKIPASVLKDQIDDYVDAKQRDGDAFNPKEKIEHVEVKETIKTGTIKENLKIVESVGSKVEYSDDKDNKSKEITKIREKSSPAVPRPLKQKPPASQDAREVDEKTAKGQAEAVDNWQPGDTCLAQWSQDSVWYRAVVEGRNGDGAYTVTFYDYGNKEKVRSDCMFRNYVALVETGKQSVLDENVKVDEDDILYSTDATLDTNLVSVEVGAAVTEIDSFGFDSNSAIFSPEVKSEIMKCSAPDQLTKLNLLTLVTELPNGTRELPVQQTLRISKDIPAPIGITVLKNKNIVISSSGDDSVKMFTAEGEMIASVQSGRPFKRPSDMSTLSTGRFVVRDDIGLQLFTEEGVYVKDMGLGQIDKCYGVTEDEEGRIITINGVRASRNAKPGSKGKGGLTNVGEMEIFYIDPESGAVVKKIQLDGIIQGKSKCRFINYSNRVIYVVDLGLDCVYALETIGNHAELFGSSGSGPGQFSDPAGLVLDHFGNVIVADSRNHRLQVFNNRNEYVGDVKVDEPLNRPSGIYLDNPGRELYILNYWGNSMVKYRIG